MTDSIDLSYSFQLGVTSPAPAPASAAPQPTFAYAHCEQIAVNDRMVVIVNPRCGGRLAVTREVAIALTYCTRFEALSDHATALCATIPMLRGQHTDVLRVLESARVAGVLVSAQETAARLAAAPTPARLAPTRVFILSCDRPAALERLLDSLLEAGELSRHERLVLIDDSRLESNIARNRELVGAFNRSSAKTMQYCGSDTAQALLSRLLTVLPDQRDGLCLLLDRARWSGQATYGLARNLALLLSVGCRALVLDDDILCRALPAPRGQPGIDFRREESREAWFYDAVPTLLQQFTACPFNPMSRQADALGQPLAAVLASLLGGSVDPLVLSHRDGAVLEVLDGSSPILMTQCGSAGDPGTVGSKWVTRLGAESVQRLLAQGVDPQSLPPCRPCWLGYTRPTIALRAVMSQMTGLDNTRLLPPYLPALRGEDAVFASMAAFLHPRAAVLNFDWAVPHLPLEDRSASDYDEPFTQPMRLGLLATHLLGKIDARASGTPQSRLLALAGEMRGLGECTAAELLAQAELEQARSAAAATATLDTLLADAANNQHPAWRAFLERQAAQARAALQTPRASDVTTPDWVAPVQSAAVALSQALAAWPLIREHAALAAAELLDA